MSLLADMITKEFNKLSRKGDEILWYLRENYHFFDVGTLIAWRKQAGEFVVAWGTFPEEAKKECWDKSGFAICSLEGTYKDRIEKKIQLVAETFNLATRPSTPICIPSESMEAGDPIDKILEEQGKVHGDSNVSGEAFARGVELLYEVGEKSGTITPHAFDGHMYSAMQCFIRLRHNPWHQDNYDDLIGYLRLAMKSIDREKQSIMGDIVDLQEAKAKKLPHVTGACVCLACQHDWIAVIPLPLPTGGFIECPSCGQKKGTVSPFYPEEPTLVCDCNNFLFFAVGKLLMCPVCARTYER